MQEEVVARKHPQRKGSRRLLTPGLKLITTCEMILQATERGDGAVEGRLIRVNVCFRDRAIGPRVGASRINSASPRLLRLPLSRRNPSNIPLRQVVPGYGSEFGGKTSGTIARRFRTAPPAEVRASSTATSAPIL